MSREKTCDSKIFPFHISARTVNREPFPITAESLWAIFNDYLFFAHIVHKVNIYSFVMMGNHFHMIVRFPEQNMSEAMRYFMGETSRQIGRISGRINQIYGRRYHKTLISTERYFRHAYKYVYRNPVKAGLCKRVEDYPFSTLNGLLGMSPLFIPIEDDFLLFKTDVELTLKWLNKAPIDSHEGEVRRALKHQNFKLARDKNTRLPSELESVEF